MNIVNQRKEYDSYIKIDNKMYPFPGESFDFDMGKAKELLEAEDQPEKYTIHLTGTAMNKTDKNYYTFCKMWLIRFDKRSRKEILIDTLRKNKSSVNKRKYCKRVQNIKGHWQIVKHG